MRYRNDRGVLTLDMAHRDKAGRDALVFGADRGFRWEAGVGVMRLRNPSPAMVRASFWHDRFYQHMRWSRSSLSLADAGFVEIYVRHGGNPIIAALCWVALRLWSHWTVWRRVKPL